MKKLFSLVFALVAFHTLHAFPEVVVEALPETALQPQVAVTEMGVVHVVYLTGDPKACDVRHTARPVAGGAWSTPVTVNSVPLSAIAVGTIRGAQLVLGKDDSLQVIWNGNGGARSPLLHARLLPGTQAFTPQQDLMGSTTALDGGASIAANAQGRVSIVWHAAAADGPVGKKGEGARLVWARTSMDDGKTFSEPVALNADQPGVCACCSLRAHLTAEGTLSVLFRAATTPTARGMCLITQPLAGRGTIVSLDDWRVAMCPMSSASLAPMAGGQMLAAWENDGHIVLGRLAGSGVPALTSYGPAKAKHPWLAVNSQGQTLVTSVLGSGWAKPGTLHWELLNPEGKVISSGDGEKLPVWGHAAAYARPDGSFVIVR